MEVMVLWAVVLCGLGYFYSWVMKLPPGLTRVRATLPLFPFMALLPWHISTNNLRGLLAFILLWVCPSKLLLLCWNSSIDNQPWLLSSFPRFAVSVLLPGRILGPSKKESAAEEEERSAIKEPKTEKKKEISKRRCWFLTPSGDLNPTGALLAIILLHNVYRFTDGRETPDLAINLAYSFHLYLGEILQLGTITSIAAWAMRIDVDPCFHSPFLSSSIADFWGQRWNRVVSTLLRATVYDPLLRLLTWNKPNSSPSRDRWKPIANGLHRNVESPSPSPPPMWTRAIAVMAAFLVSGLVHEVIFFYLHRTSDAIGAYLAFFLIHGFATSAESALRRALSSRWRLSRFISWLCTFLFIYGTACWLFFPTLNKTRVIKDTIDEYFKLERYLLSMILN